MSEAPCLDGIGTLATSVAAWQERHGRHHLPWQGTHDPYRIWLSEIMLQQTQVATVIPYYQRFLERFPTVLALAEASQDDVMPYWAGLGYYARARNLHRCAQTVRDTHEGQFPSTSRELATLPGIGRSTAASIAAFAYGERSPIMDGNVKRVFTRFFGIYGETTRRAVEVVLWDTATQTLEQAPDTLDIRRYTQGLMDLGSSVCTRRNPDCPACPLQTDCYARRHDAQHSLPQPRRRKPVPERHCTMLILENDGHVLLQQQPSPGIWGGLWSLPRFDDASELEALLARQQIATVAGRSLEPLVHTFSHFRLHIDARHLILQSAPACVSDAALPEVWRPLGHVPDTALPAPVRTLLERVFATQT